MEKNSEMVVSATTPDLLDLVACARRSAAAIETYRLTGTGDFTLTSALLFRLSRELQETFNGCLPAYMQRTACCGESVLVVAAISSRLISVTEAECLPDLLCTLRELPMIPDPLRSLFMARLANFFSLLAELIIRSPGYQEGRQLVSRKLP